MTCEKRSSWSSRGSTEHCEKDLSQKRTRGSNLKTKLSRINSSARNAAAADISPEIACPAILEMKSLSTGTFHISRQFLICFGRAMDSEYEALMSELGGGKKGPLSQNRGGFSTQNYHGTASIQRVRA